MLNFFFVHSFFLVLLFAERLAFVVSGAWVVGLLILASLSLPQVERNWFWIRRKRSLEHKSTSDRSNAASLRTRNVEQN